jgi:hypothetical protein
MSDNSVAEEILTTDDDQLAGVLDTIDRSDPAAVGGVLAAMKTISEEFVVPASELLVRGEDDGWTHFDLDDLAGYEYPGLISGVLKMDFPTLASPPPEGVLAERLEAAGFDIDDPAQRLRFFRGWMAFRASAVLEALANFLGHGGATFDDEQLDALDELVRMPLRAQTRWRLADLLAATSPDRARALLETTEPDYLRQALKEALRSAGGPTPP